MKKYKLIIAIESVLVVLFLAIILIGNFNNDKTRDIKAEEHSYNEDFKLTVFQVGDPAFPFGDVEYEVLVQKNNADSQYYTVSEFSVTVSDDGGVGEFETEWQDDFLKITFEGSEQKPNTVIIPLN